MGRPLSPSTLFLDLLGIGASFGGVLGTDATSGGFIVGGVLTIGLFVIMLIVMSKVEGGGEGPSLLSLAFGMVLSVIFGWWPVWTMFIVGIILAWLVLKPMGGSQAA